MDVVTALREGWNEEREPQERSPLGDEEDAHGLRTIAGDLRVSASLR